MGYREIDELWAELAVLKQYLGIEIRQCNHKTHVMFNDKCVNCGKGKLDFGKYIVRTK